MTRFPESIWGSILQYTYEIEHRRKMRGVMVSMRAYHAMKRPRVFVREEDVLYTGMTPCHGKIQLGPGTFFTGRLMMDVHNPYIFASRTISNHWSLHDISDNPGEIFLYENDAWVQVYHHTDGNRGGIGALLGRFA